MVPHKKTGHLLLKTAIKALWMSCKGIQIKSLLLV
jgi:hypothetical protein